MASIHAPRAVVRGMSSRIGARLSASVILAAGTGLLGWGVFVLPSTGPPSAPEWVRTGVLGSATLLMLVGLATYRLQLRRRVESAMVSAASLIVVANLCSFIWVSQSGFPSDILGLVLIVAGLTIGSLSAVVAVVATTLLAWGVVAWPVVTPSEWSLYASVLFMSGMMAIILAVLRIRIESATVGVGGHLERSLKRAETLAALAQGMHSHSEWMGFLEWALPQVRACLGEVLMEVLEADRDDPTLRLIGGQGWSSGLDGPVSIPITSDALQARTYRGGGSEVAADLRRSPETLPTHYERVGIRSACCTLISGGERPFGTLTAFSTRAHAFAPDDLRFLEQVAQVFGLGIVASRGDQDRRRREQAHNAAQRLANVGCWDWDILRDEIEWSDEVYRIFDFVPAADFHTLSTFMELVHPDDRTMVQASVDGALGGMPYSIEYRVVRRDGELRCVQETGEVTRNEAGKPVRMVGTVHDVTDRRRLEQEQQARDRQFQVILESAPDGILIVGKDRKISFVNHQAELIFGYPKAELLDGPLDRLLPKETRGIHEKLEVDYRKKPFARPMGESPVQLWASHKNGARIPVEISLAPIRLGGDQQVMATIRDVTQRRLVEENLREEHRRFQATFDQAAVGIAHVSLDRKFIQVNRKFAEIVGRDADEMTGAEYDEMVFPEDVQTDQDMLSELLQGNRDTYSIEKRYSRPGHSPVWVELTVSLSRDAGGEPGYLIYVIADITVRKTLMMELGWEREFLRMLFDNIPVMIATVRPTSGAKPDPPSVRVNEEFRRATGWAETGEALFNACFPTDDIQSLFFGAAVSAEVIWDDLELPTAAGAKIHVTWCHLQLSDGTLVGIGMDESRRRELEAQLRQSDKMQAIGALAGGVAHDFNNLLTVISGRGQMIADDLEPDSEAYQSVQEILKSADIAAGVTKDLLSFSRREEVVLEGVSLNDVFLGVEGLLGTLIPSDIELVSHLDPGLSIVRGSRVQLEQVIMNLIVNAKDAMENEGGLLTVETVNTLVSADDVGHGSSVPPGPYAALLVRDTGCGMSESIAERIFEPFFTTKKTGTGIGLATVYGIVEAFGGAVQVETAEGVGTTFTVLLPVERRNFDRKVIARRASDMGDLKGSETVILAEDSRELRQLAGEVLADAGYTVMEARNGADALRIAERLEGRVDALVTDVVMPKMGGVELRDHLLRMNPELKTLYMSGYSREGLKDLDTEGPACSFLPKPFDFQDLLLALQELLKTP